MNLLLKRNHANVEIDLSSEEFVAVKTIDNSGWEHLEIAGFMTLPESKMFDPMLERKVACNAWRHTMMDRWQYLEKNQYVVAIELQNKICIVLDAVKPHIKTCDQLANTEQRNKAKVISLFKKPDHPNH